MGVREEFEAWVLDPDGWGGTQDALIREGERYYELEVCVLWTGWQGAYARLSAGHSPLPEAIAGGPLHGLYTADQMREYRAAGRAEALVELHPAWLAEKERADRAEARLVALRAGVGGLRRFEEEGELIRRDDVLALFGKEGE